jgi:hypothetical protein
VSRFSSKSTIRVFAVDRVSGAPRSNVCLAVSIVHKASPNTPSQPPQVFTLKLCQTDSAGYASVPLDKALSQFNSKLVSELWVHPISDRKLGVECLSNFTISEGRTPILLSLPESVKAISQRIYPAIVRPDPFDRWFSPNSFASNPQLTLGQGGCADLLHNALAERVFLIGQLVIDNAPARDAFDPTDEFRRSSIRYREGVFLEYEVSWWPLGHALGDIVYSLPLAPCESVNLSVIEWSRREVAQRDEATVASEELIHQQRRDRSIVETMKGSIQEWQRGGTVQAGISASGILEGLSLGLGLGGGYSTTSANRNVTAESIQTLADSVEQASALLRTQQSTVIVQGSQSERDVIETRNVTNHNHCHALTLLYYEVLRHYRVETRFARGRSVLLIKVDPLDFSDAHTVLCKRVFLEPYLLDRSLAKCFDAVAKKHHGQEDPPSEAPTQPTQNLAVRLQCITTTGREGMDYSRVYFYLEFHDGTHTDKQYRLGGDFEAGDRDVTEFTFNPPIDLNAVKHVGIKFEPDSGFIENDAWSLKRLEVMYQPQLPSRGTATASPFSPFYDSDADSTPSRPLPIEFQNRTSIWKSRPFEKEDTEEVDDTSRSAHATCCSRPFTDETCSRLLLEHLQCHQSYYQRVVWMQTDPGDWVKLFESKQGPSGQPLVGLIEPKPVGVMGEYVAFPANIPSILLEQIKKLPPETEIRFASLPTRGVFAEAKLGQCNSCEVKDVTRFWDWSKSPCPCSAPDITNIQPGSRAQGVDTRPSPLTSPVLNIVNPPSAPDPTGMAAGLNLLGTAEIFRDMSTKGEVSALLQKLVEGTISLEEAKSKAAEQLANISKPRRISAEETHDKNTVVRQTPEIDDRQRRRRIEDNLDDMQEDDEEAEVGIEEDNEEEETETVPSFNALEFEVTDISFPVSGADTEADEVTITGRVRGISGILADDTRTGGPWYIFVIEGTGTAVGASLGSINLGPVMATTRRWVQLPEGFVEQRAKATGGMASLGSGAGFLLLEFPNLGVRARFQLAGTDLPGIGAFVITSNGKVTSVTPE